jgi:hypothetical protein
VTLGRWRGVVVATLVMAITLQVATKLKTQSTTATNIRTGGPKDLITRVLFYRDCRRDRTSSMTYTANSLQTLSIVWCHPDRETVAKTKQERSHKLGWAQSCTMPINIFKTKLLESDTQ